MSATYCYWSVADGPYAALLERCVGSARGAGVFDPFVALSDQPIEGCDCYDSMQCDKEHGLFKLHVLKAGMSKLPYDYLIWIDADSLFVRNPVDIVSGRACSPIHVPLEVNLSAMKGDRQWKGVSCFRLRELFERAGLSNQVYLSQSAFWIVHREAIDDVFEQAFTFWNFAKREGVVLDVDAALGFAMQIFCADPEAHLLSSRPRIWASDDLGYFAQRVPDGKPWPCRHPLLEGAITVRPAIIHLPLARAALAELAEVPPTAQAVCDSRALEPPS